MNGPEVGRPRKNKCNFFCILLLPFSIGSVYAADTGTAQSTIQKTLDKIFLPNKGFVAQRFEMQSAPN
ncbi:MULTISPECIES: hypothetical protein [unclassified Acinetobacter]|uniref:hypothetical protein n=1 Tax=unclassified Acinetobacter TaxID=196816 RepID=UPI0015D19737|nr:MULTISPECIES: hypothetical protein [unclassified Acinetobacter]